LLSHFAPLLELEPIWLLTPQEELSEPERLFQYLFVDLLLEEHGFQPADLLTWRQNLIAMLTNAGSVEALWWNYIKGRAAEAQAQAASRPSSPWPEQDLYLACRDNNLEFGLYRYNPRTDTWTKERSLGDENAALMPLPDDSGLVISTGVFEPETFILLPDGTEIPISPDAGTISLPAEAVVDPGGRYLLLYHTSPTTFNTVYLDTNSCDGSGCSLIIAAQLPVWSPDGAQVLLWSNGMLQQGENMEGPFTAVASGGVNSHFWRDNNTPGYVAGLGDRVLLVTGNNASPEVWLNAADLISAAPPELQQGSWKIQEVYPTPDTNAFLVSATVRGGQTYHLFLVREDDDNESETVDGLPNPAVYYLTAMPHQPQSLHVSPDGQWLAVPVFKEESSNGQQFIIYNLHVPEQAVQSQLPFSMTTHNLDWSADGRWLARIGDGLLEFIGTAEGTDTYNHYAFYDDLDCRSLAWVGAAQD
jgi:hypothetical protein